MLVDDPEMLELVHVQAAMDGDTSAPVDEHDCMPGPSEEPAGD